PTRRALEEQVLEEVREARLLDRFVARSVLDPDADGDRWAVRQLLGEDADAVGEPGGAHALRACAFAAVGLLEGFLAGQAGLARLAAREHFDVDPTALAEPVRPLPYPLVRELGYVHQPVRPGKDLHEGPEVHDLAHGAPVDLSDLGLGRHCADAVDRA